MLAEPLTAVVYQGGKFTAHDTRMAAISLSAMSLGIPAFMLGLPDGITELLALLRELFGQARDLVELFPARREATLQGADLLVGAGRAAGPPLPVALGGHPPLALHLPLALDAGHDRPCLRDRATMRRHRRLRLLERLVRVGVVGEQVE